MTDVLNPPKDPPTASPTRAKPVGKVLAITSLRGTPSGLFRGARETNVHISTHSAVP